MMTTGVPIAIAIAISFSTASAQHDPRVEPAPAYVIQGATIHTLAGAAIEDGSVVVSGGPGWWTLIAAWVSPRSDRSR
jgi:hypothetical protein